MVSVLSAVWVLFQSDFVNQFMPLLDTDTSSILLAWDLKFYATPSYRCFRVG